MSLKQKLRALVGKTPESSASASPVASIAMEQLPEQTRRLIEQAQKRNAEGEFVAALRLAQQAVASAPKAAGLSFFYGFCLEQVGRHEEALAAYEQELSINPGHAVAAQRREPLLKAFAKPQASALSSKERPYNTSLPLETLQVMQQSLHNYTYRGVPMLKNPFDMALYPLLLWNLKPKTVIEIGSKSGGSALWFGDMIENFKLDAKILSIDIVKVSSVAHERVTFMEGDGRKLGNLLTDTFLQNLPRPWLVIEDADHAYETSSAVLKFFHRWLRPNEYIVVEDGIISDLSQIKDCNSGPHRALKEFLAAHGAEYDIDGQYCDFFGYNVTWCTNGFLRKKAAGPA